MSVEKVCHAMCGCPDHFPNGPRAQLDRLTDVAGDLVDALNDELRYEVGRNLHVQEHMRKVITELGGPWLGYLNEWWLGGEEQETTFDESEFVEVSRPRNAVASEEGGGGMSVSEVVCPTCEGSACEEGCGQCDYAHVGPDSHKVCVRCHGAGVMAATPPSGPSAEQGGR